MRSMKWGLFAIALVALPIDRAPAQQSRPGHAGMYASLAREGYHLGKAQAEKLEAALAGNPDDLAARARLIGYYFRGAARQETPQARIAARRRHILWLIAHHPASELAGLRQATIDPAGHALADKDGYEQASALWMQQAERHGGDAAVLGNAADFFLLPDKARAAALIERAQQPTKLGYLYAIGILGVDMMNENGFPVSHDPAEAKGNFARRAREELERSVDATMIGTAGMILSQYGVILEGTFRGTKRPLTVDYAPLAEAFLMKAQELDAANEAASRIWSNALEQFRKLRQELDRRK